MDIMFISCSWDNVHGIGSWDIHILMGVHTSSSISCGILVWFEWDLNGSSSILVNYIWDIVWDISWDITGI